MTVTNTSGSTVHSELTDASGEIGKEELIEYINVGGSKTFHTLHVVNVSKTGYQTNTTTYNLTTEQNILHYVNLTGAISYNVNLTQSFTTTSSVSRFYGFIRTLIQRINIFPPSNRTHNFSGTFNSLAFNNTVAESPPGIFTPAGETEINYTKIEDSDDDHATDISTTYPYHKFNMSITESNIN